MQYHRVLCYFCESLISYENEVCPRCGGNMGPTIDRENYRRTHWSQKREVYYSTPCDWSAGAAYFCDGGRTYEA